MLPPHTRPKSPTALFVSQCGLPEVFVSFALLQGSVWSQRCIKEKSANTIGRHMRVKRCHLKATTARHRCHLKATTARHDLSERRLLAQTQELHGP
eukprot:7021313-Pyramimonas_sp.AAC.1